MTTPNLTPKLYGVCDLKIFKMLTDVEGTAPTYDTVGIDMPGVSAVSVANEAKIVEGKGDERVLEIEITDDSSKVSFEMLYTPLSAMVVINGGDLETAVDTDSATYYSPGPSDIGEYFKIEALTKSRKEKLIIYKNKGRLYPDGLKGSSFNSPAYVGTAIHTTGDINAKPRRFALMQSNIAIVAGV